MQGYIIYHNATINGNTTSVFVPSNSSLLFHEIEIPTECPCYWFEVSVAIVNVLGEGEKVTSIIKIIPIGKQNYHYSVRFIVNLQSSINLFNINNELSHAPDIIFSYIVNGGYHIVL